MLIKPCVLFILTSSLWALHAVPQKKMLPTDPVSVAKRHAKRFMQRYKIPGMAIVIYKNSRHYFVNIGYADRDNKVLVTPWTIFEIGSVTKLFTALLIAQELQAGRMRLSDSITKHIPVLASNKRLKDMTLERLLTHTAGLPFNAPDRVKTKEDLIRCIQQWQRPVVGHAWQYSNHGVELLRIALEEQTHQSINRLLIDRVLLPLGMEPIGIYVPEKEKRRYAKCYNVQGGLTHEWRHPHQLGTAALRASSNDMLHFLKAALGTTDTPAALRKAMQLAQTPIIRVGTFKQAMGWQVYGGQKRKNAPVHIKPEHRTYCGGCLLDKTGTTEGFHCYVGVIPARGVGVVAMINKRLPPLGFKRMGNFGKGLLRAIAHPSSRSS